MYKVRFRDIPDDVGGDGVGAEFKKVFPKWIAENNRKYPQRRSGGDSGEYLIEVTLR